MKAKRPIKKCTINKMFGSCHFSKGDGWQSK